MPREPAASAAGARKQAKKRQDKTLRALRLPPTTIIHHPSSPTHQSTSKPSPTKLSRLLTHCISTFCRFILSSVARLLRCGRALSADSSSTFATSPPHRLPLPPFTTRRACPSVHRRPQTFSPYSLSLQPLPSVFLSVIVRRTVYFRE